MLNIKVWIILKPGYIRGWNQVKLVIAQWLRGPKDPRFTMWHCVNIMSCKCIFYTVCITRSHLKLKGWPP